MMGSGYLTDPVVFLIQTAFGLYILVVLLRFFLQLVHADFHNPVSQFVVKVTSPVLNPLRRVIPGVAGMDLSSLVLAWLLQTLELVLVLSLSGYGLQLLLPALQAIPELVGLSFNIFLVAVFIQVILSWISPGGYNPATAVIYSLTEPLLEPARRVIPTVSGLDLSPMLVVVGLIVAKMLVVPPLQAFAAQIAG
jgi:YggT family protein